MAKKNLPLSNLGCQHIADHLAHYFPWLRASEFRVLKETELESTDVFKELFPEIEQTDENKHWLTTVYKYQQCNTKTREILTSPNTETLPKQ